MQKAKLTVEKFVSVQVKKWGESLSEEDRKRAVCIPIITVAMEPGSLGYLVAQGLAKRLEFDLFHRELLDEMARTGKVSKEKLSAMEKSRYSGLQDFFAALIQKDYLHPSVYLDFLRKVIGHIEKSGHAIIVGRGANFILPPEKRFAVYVSAPLEKRVRNVAKAYKTSLDEARKRVVNRESKRKAFIKDCFGETIADPKNYDMLINTGELSVEAALAAVIGALIGAQLQGRFRQ